MKVKTVELKGTVLNLKELPRSRVAEFAVMGRSNVGKSSLLNSLLNRKNIARISKAPGKTRTINFFSVNDRFFLVDLPGYGFAKVPRSEREKWRKVIMLYIASREQLAGIVHLIDSRHPPSEDDVEILVELSGVGKDFIVVLTKADKVKSSRRREAIERFEESFENLCLVDPMTGQALLRRELSSERIHVPALFFSAKSGEGKDALWRWIEGRID